MLALACLLGAWTGFIGPAAASQPEGPAKEVGVEVRSTLAFLLSEDTQSIEAALRTELNDLEVEVRIVAVPGDETLAQRLRRARSTASERASTIAVYWFDRDDEGALLVHLVDPAGERMLVRRIAAPDESRATEALAVVVRGTATALLDGRAIGMEPVPPPEPGTDSERAPGLDEPDAPGVRARERGRVRIRAGYAGSTFAVQDPWDNGIDLDLGWRWKVGLHLALGYTAIVDPFLSPRASSEAPVTEVEVAMNRHPLHLAAGWGRRWGPRLGLEAELRFVVDPVTLDVRTFVGDGAEDDALTLSTPTTSVQLGLEPRLRMRINLLPQLALYLGGGAQFLMRGEDVIVRFRDEDGDLGQAMPLATMRRLRPVAAAGLLVFL